MDDSCFIQTASGGRRLILKKIILMSIAEKIGHSADKTRFTLFKEGMFYKCYNEDAMVFAQKVRSYKINSKLVKNVDSVVLSLGFSVRCLKD